MLSITLWLLLLEELSVGGLMLEKGYARSFDVNVCCTSTTIQNAIPMFNADLLYAPQHIGGCFVFFFFYRDRYEN